MNDAIRQLIRHRAGDRCEYCHLPQVGHEERFSIDHVVARKHGGTDDVANLALCCLRCNLYKGTDLTGIDPMGRDVVPLFDPRRQAWHEHFLWQRAILIGITPIGRATVLLLQINAQARVRMREALIAEGIMSND